MTVPILCNVVSWEPLDRELDQLEAARVIEKVTNSDWAAPIVAILKNDGCLASVETTR